MGNRCFTSCLLHISAIQEDSFHQSGPIFLTSGRQRFSKVSQMRLQRIFPKKVQVVNYGGRRYLIGSEYMFVVLLFFSEVYWRVFGW